MNITKSIHYLILGFTLALLSLTGYHTLAQQTEQSKEESTRPTQKVVATLVQNGTITKTLELSGTVQGHQETNLAPKVSGRLVELRKQAGDPVKKGEVLAVLDGSELWAQQAVAAAQVQSARSTLAETEDYYNQLIEEAEEAEDIADDNDDDDAEDLAEEAVKSAEKVRDLQVAQARNQLNIAQKELALTQAQAQNTRLVAPYDGFVTSQNLDVGALASPQAAIFSLAQTGPRELEVSLPASQLEHVFVGQIVTATNPETGQKFSGTLTAIGNTSAQAGRKTTLTISLESPAKTGKGENKEGHQLDLSDYSDELPLGTLLTIEIPLEEVSGLVIPTSAIRQDYHQQLVMVVQNGQAYRRPVTLGTSQNDQVLVLSGLQAGEKVITQGHQYLTDGAPIEE